MSLCCLFTLSLEESSRDPLYRIYEFPGVNDQLSDCFSPQLQPSGLFKADITSYLIFRKQREWSDGNLQCIINILKSFFFASGLQINIFKSQLLGVGVSRSVVEQAASSIGCSILSNQFRYLGVMVGECLSRLKAWDDIISKLRARLSKWKMKTLSIGGRLTLLKSVLGASPIYNMSIFKVPRGVLKVMEAIRSRFFNGTGQSDKKITWVAWNKVLASKNRGGLGVSIFLLLIEPSSSNGYGVSCLKTGLFVRELHHLKEKGFDFWSHCKKRIGNGINTRFWSDCWIGDLPLHAKFPRLYALELDKDASVAVKLSAHVDISFRRRARGGLEQHLMAEMQSMLDLISLSNSSDRWFCDLASDGIFRVKEVRNFIDDLFLTSHPDSTRWVKSIPIKINIFTWRARRDCLPTRANLVRRGVRLESPLCPVCLSCEEDVHHILFRCDLALNILRRFCRWWDLDSQGWSSFQKWQTWFSSIRLSSKVKSLLEGVFSFAWWLIWRFRNRTIFEKNPPRRTELFDDIVLSAFNWCNSRCRRTFSWVDWLKTPH
nr:RNA-directed DNA polymerase, eukaryota [Tanacetum cinerariifolium]